MPFSDHFKPFNKIRIIRILVLFIIVIILTIFLTSSPIQRNFHTKVFAQLPPQSNNPGVGATASAQTVFWVYGGPLVGDQPAPGWGNNTTYGAGNTVNLTNTTPVYNGIHSISYQVTAPYADKCALGIMNATDPALDISPYTYFTFYALGTQQNQSYGVQLIGANGQVMGSNVSMINYGGPIPITPPWFVYNIPITAFAAPSTIIRGVVFSDVNGSAQPNVYLDDIAFSSVRGETIQAVNPLGPPSTPMPTPTTIPDYYPQISPWVYIIPGVIIFIAVLFQ